MEGEPIVWDRVEWRQGDGSYRFEVAKGGLHATFSAPTGASLTLPMVAWEALLDAVGAARKTKARSTRAMPSRAGARWSGTETDELVAAFKSGASVDSLAVTHNRTTHAIEAQLAALGLWDRMAGAPRGMARASRPMLPPDWPPDPPTPTTFRGRRDG